MRFDLLTHGKEHGHPLEYSFATLRESIKFAKKLSTERNWQVSIFDSERYDVDSTGYLGTYEQGKRVY